MLATRVRHCGCDHLTMFWGEAESLFSSGRLFFRVSTVTSSCPFFVRFCIPYGPPKHGGRRLGSPVPRGQIQECGHEVCTAEYLIEPSQGAGQSAQEQHVHSRRVNRLPCLGGYFVLLVLYSLFVT